MGHFQQVIGVMLIVFHNHNDAVSRLDVVSIICGRRIDRGQGSRNGRGIQIYT